MGRFQAQNRTHPLYVHTRPMVSLMMSTERVAVNRAERAHVLNPPLLPVGFPTRQGTNVKSACRQLQKCTNPHRQWHCKPSCTGRSMRKQAQDAPFRYQDLAALVSRAPYRYIDGGCHCIDCKKCMMKQVKTGKAAQPPPPPPPPPPGGQVRPRPVISPRAEPGLTAW